AGRPGLAPAAVDLCRTERPCLFARDIDEELAGEAVGGLDGVDALLHLALVEVAAEFRLRQPGDLQGQRKEPHELRHLLLLTVDPLVARAHGEPLSLGVSAVAMIGRNDCFSLTGPRAHLKLSRS